MTVFFILILLIFGICLIVLEILILPGLIAGIAGGIFILMGLAWSWQLYGAQTGMIIAAITLTVLFIVISIALKSGFWKRFSLQNQLDGKMNVIDESTVSAGDSGAAVSSLRPMGTVRVNGLRFEATTEGEMVPPNYPIIVLRVEPGRLVVKPKID